MPRDENSEPTTEPKLRRLMLHDWHEEKGAEWRTLDAHRVVAHYGSPDEELAVATDRAVIADVSDRARLELVGEDRVRFLAGLVTCDVASLEPGTGCYGYFTSPKGRVMADVTVLSLADRLWLELPRGTAQSLREHLEKYVVADRVEVRSIDDVLLFRVVGAGLADWLEARGIDRLEGAFAHHAVELEGTDVHVSSTPLEGRPAVSLWISSGIAGPVLDDLLATGLELAGQDCLETLRAAAGVPRFGVDFQDSNLPQEVRVDSAISYEKGCYLGQEIVARLHYRGKPARELRRVRGEGSTPSTSEELALSLDGTPAGAITSVAADGAQNGWSGLAMVARKALDAEMLDGPAGTRVTVLGPPDVAV
ncbi:MAG: hypothetical protein AAGK22_01310 [Acidobacteriota bacterium]